MAISIPLLSRIFFPGTTLLKLSRLRSSGAYLFWKCFGFSLTRITNSFPLIQIEGVTLTMRSVCLMVQWRLTGLQPTQAISSRSTEEVSIFSLTPVWPSPIKDSQPSHTYVQEKKTRERYYWTLVRVELIPSNKDLINCIEACCRQLLHSENGASLRKRKKAKTKQNKNKLVLGRTQLVLPFPTPTLSLITPPEGNGGGIIDGNMCSHIHRGSEIKQAVQESTDHHPPSQQQRLPAADGSGHGAWTWEADPSGFASWFHI